MATVNPLIFVLTAKYCPSLQAPRQTHALQPNLTLIATPGFNSP